MGVQFKYSFELYDDFAKSKLLFEGAQSIMLDCNFGTYPYVTSGGCGINGIINSGFSQFLPSKIYGITKCYCTRVGEGPFPTEIFGEEAENLRKLGNEYGSTTGRPRRIGWLDLPALNYACKKGGITNLIVTKFDILNGMKTVSVCHKYDKTPVCGADFFAARPEYIKMDGWKDAKDISQLKNFLLFIEDHVELPISYVSCGTGDKDIYDI